MKDLKVSGVHNKSMVRRVVENGFMTWLGIIFIGSLLFTGKASHIIGNYFPVMTPLQITSIRPGESQGLESSIISGTSIKLRDCDQRGMNWFISEGKNEGSVFSIFLDRPQSRDVGPIEFRGIVVGLPPDKIELTRAEVSHDCFGGKVRVVTDFFVGKDVQ